HVAELAALQPPHRDQQHHHDDPRREDRGTGDEGSEVEDCGYARLGRGAGAGKCRAADRLGLEQAYLRRRVISPPRPGPKTYDDERSEEHTSELQSLAYLVCR